MPTPDRPPHPLVALRLRYRDRYDVVSMAGYVLLVYGWGLWVHPMGRDYAHLAEGGGSLPFLADVIFGWEMRAFGGSPVGYHAVNIVLMYACMVFVYFITNAIVKGLWWFGTLAACMFMANPVHAESVLNLSGVADLVPCMAGLAALWSYVWAATRGGILRTVAAAVLFTIATVNYTSNLGLVAVVFLYEWSFGDSGRKRWGRLAVFAVLSLAAVGSSRDALRTADWHLGSMYGPLYLVFYPLGFLPETVQGFYRYPLLGWVSASLVVGVAALIYRKARRPAILFGLSSACALRLAPDERPIDLVHMVGGGQLLLANALFVVALVALFFRIMDHPRWRTSMVGITTMIVIIFFGMQWRAIRHWHDAGKSVAEFQRLAAERSHQTPDAALGVLPDFQCYYGAPMFLTESIAHATPFSQRISAVSLLPMHADKADAVSIEITEWSEKGGSVLVAGRRSVRPLTYFKAPSPIEVPGDAVMVYELLSSGSAQAADATVALEEITENGFRLSIQGQSRLPEFLASAPLPGEKARNKPKADATDNDRKPTEGSRGDYAPTVQ